MTPRLRNALVAGGVLVAVAGGGYAAFGHRDAERPAAAAPAAEPGIVSFAANAPELDMIAVAPAVDAPLPVSGDLNARLAVDESVTGRVASPVTGRIVQLIADIGERVGRGQALATIDSPDLGQAQADLAKASTEAQLKREALDRARALFEAQAMSRRDLEAATADLAEAQAERERAALRVNNLGGGRGEQLALRSPVAGTVVERQANPGLQLQPGQGPLFTISDTSRLWLLIDVPERDAGRARVGETIDFTVDAFTDRRFQATVLKIAPEVDPSTRRIQVRGAVANKDGSLRPEMFARARLVADDGRRAVQVPNAALIESGLKSYAFVEERPGRFRRVAVTVAERGPDASFVSAGLKAGQRVVGEGALLLNAQLAGSGD